MDTQKIIASAIQNLLSISFRYDKPDKVKGMRVGNPHALFPLPGQRERGIKAHIVQTEGVSDSKDSKAFPSFRMFNLSEISEVKILSDRSSFSVDPAYNPNWDGYIEAIEKI